MTTIKSSTAASTSTQTGTTKAAKKKARLPPVIDRAGVALDASTAAGATAAIAMPMPAATTDPAVAVAAAPSPQTPATAVAGTPAMPTPTTAPTDPTAGSPTPVAAPAPAPVATPAPAPAPVPVDPSTVPFASAPPNVMVPVPPAGFVAVRALDLKGYRPMQSELASVPDAVAELQMFPNWSLIFGITAPPSAQLAQRLQVAAQWTSLLAQTSSWSSYVKSMEGMAWKDALQVIESLKVPFQLASSASPSMLNQYPALARLLGAQKVVAKRAVSTKKKNKAAAAATAAASTTAAAAPAPAAAETTAATPARVVTVQG